jgi:hypothetical protein
LPQNEQYNDGFSSDFFTLSSFAFPAGGGLLCIRSLDERSGSRHRFRRNTDGRVNGRWKAVENVGPAAASPQGIA